MKSPITGKEMSLKREMSVLKFRKMDFEYSNHFYFCDSSKEKFTTTELDELNLAQVYNAYRDNSNLPFPAEILEIRSQYKLSASKMSKILGLGANGYGKYENGEVPSNSNGRLIQLIRDPRRFKEIVSLCQTIDMEFKTELHNRIDRLIQEATKNKFSATMEDYLLGSHLPDSQSGFVKPSFIKLTEMVKFFANRLQPWKTVLNKLLFYSDFLAYRSRCFSISGVRYRAIRMGPVPNNYNSIYEYMANQEQIDIVNVNFSDTVFGDKFKELENAPFNESLFDAYELQILEQVSAKFSNMNTPEVIDFSHNEKAWIDNEKERNIIDYKYAFEIDQI